MKLPKNIRDQFVKMGRKGGKKRAQNLTAEQRSEIARMGGHAKKMVRLAKTA